VPRLDFAHVHSYSSSAEGVALPIALRSGPETVDLLAYIDTGASNCLFEREYGEMLLLNVEAGQPKTFWTATGPVDTFGHVVSLEVFDLELESMVYFFADERINRNLLGRMGWLDRVRLGLVEYEHQIYLAPYDFKSD
jgi:hypothetical protein